MNRPPLHLFAYQGREFSIGDLIKALTALGIKPEDRLFVHSDLRSFGKVNPQISQEDYPKAFVDALTRIVGENGTIIMPTFSYSFCRGEIYDPRETASTVGSLTEYFRQLPGVERTIDPIFSVAIWGAGQEFYQRVGSNCFGQDSIFQKIYDADFKILFLGETFALTFLHFIEQDMGVPYRYIKRFTGKIKVGSQLAMHAFDYYVRDLNQDPCYNLERIADCLKNGGFLHEVALGFSKIRVVGAGDAYKTIAQILRKDRRGLLARGKSKNV